MKQLIICRERKTEDVLEQCLNKYKKKYSIDFLVQYFPVLTYKTNEQIKESSQWLTAIKNARIIVFSSKNAVEHFNYLLSLQKTISNKFNNKILPGKKIYAIGQSTASYIQSQSAFKDLPVKAAPDNNESSLWSEFKKKHHPREMILLIRGDRHSLYLDKKLKNCHWKYYFLKVFKTTVNYHAIEEIRKILKLNSEFKASKNKPQIFLFLSAASQWEELVKNISLMEIQLLASRLHLICFGHKCYSRVLEHGIKPFFYYPSTDLSFFIDCFFRQSANCLSR